MSQGSVGADGAEEIMPQYSIGANATNHIMPQASGLPMGQMSEEMVTCAFGYNASVGTDGTYEMMPQSS
eukprot:9493306-Karenia_brevis.AAC.1